MMSHKFKASPVLDNQEMHVRPKLAAAWTSFMFLYIYVDYLCLYKPGHLQGILNGMVWEFEVSQGFMTFALFSVSIPACMILLSMVLPARLARSLNLVFGVLYIPYSIFNIAGGVWVYFFGLGILIEVLLLAFILRTAWAWPRKVY